MRRVFTLVLVSMVATLVACKDEVVQKADVVEVIAAPVVVESVEVMESVEEVRTPLVPAIVLPMDPPMSEPEAEVPNPPLVVPDVPNPNLTVPETPIEAVGLFPAIAKAQKDKDWILFAGLILSILIFLLRMFWVYIPKRFVIPVSAGVGLVWYIVGSLGTGRSWLVILTSTVATTAVSVLFYELVKPLLKKWGIIKDEPKV